MVTPWTRLHLAKQNATSNRGGVFEFEIEIRIMLEVESAFIHIVKTHNIPHTNLSIDAHNRADFVL